MRNAAAVWPEGMLNLSLGVIAMLHSSICTNGLSRLIEAFSTIKQGISIRNAINAVFTNVIDCIVWR